MPPAAAETLHASCVALDGRGLLILGPSGSGKSALALQLMAHGARLVADDRCLLHARAGRLVASCPPRLSGLIEARGVGILKADPLAEAVLVLAVDLGHGEPDRLPPRRSLRLLDCELPLVLRPQNPHLADALVLWLRGGRQE